MADEAVTKPPRTITERDMVQMYKSGTVTLTPQMLDEMTEEACVALGNLALVDAAQRYYMEHSRKRHGRCMCRACEYVRLMDRLSKEISKIKEEKKHAQGQGTQAPAAHVTPAADGHAVGSQPGGEGTPPGASPR